VTVIQQQVNDELVSLYFRYTTIPKLNVYCSWSGTTPQTTINKAIKSRTPCSNLGWKHAFRLALDILDTYEIYPGIHISTNFTNCNNIVF